MIEAHLKKLRKRVNISREEEEAIRGAMSEVREVRADRTIIRRGEELNTSLMLLSGWLARTRDLATGQRQVSELHVTGDFADLHAFTLKRLDHNVITMSPCTIAVFPHERLVHLFERFPHLARIYWFITNVDAAIHREWTVSLGRRSALSRMAHLFAELLVRLEIVGETDGNSFEFPLTQQELGECLGLTSVHVNRTLQELRRRNLIELENRRATILDLEGLHDVAEFDPFYLYLEHRDR
ncbi:Crp/Fnr family transcriptional regulator [Sphingomonas sp. SM33]|uniref:Crp/Fnr family transcriptional regulator n=1 Tax=Sphingomonas telluris TaxID=2907998 RepID=A0ABS9VMX6_9SPHN|nr:Crp/Fnr family transcriptional regulator [Sphingomonas telluris]MCH8616320.1 Crp/Fnr family transcriptional regulator [Sphingomonas telluris]